MAHDEEGVEAEGDCDADFAMDNGEDGGKPPSFAGVEEEEDDVVILDEFLEFIHAFE